VLRECRLRRGETWEQSRTAYERGGDGAQCRLPLSAHAESWLSLIWLAASVFRFLVRDHCACRAACLQADGEIANPTFEENDADSPSQFRKLGDLPSEEPGGSAADTAKRADTSRSDTRSKTDVVRSLTYYSLGIVSQAVVFTCMW
jgi:hypothetical protein